MATAETVKLGDAHEPKGDSVKVYNQIEHELKRSLIRLRHQLNKHEPAYFAAAEHLSDQQLVDFGADDFQQVRVAASAYGLHVFGKVRIPALSNEGPAYVHFRAFTLGPDDQASLHAIHTEDKETPGGGHSYRAIFTKEDTLEWFDT
ncbi:hypothetical protein VTJ04DRAFT_3067 [Mycothermus thermophilus]|uniref:uncharacterized protein n=1 Tax=Humicola insolens TaxID=85995 RepID=UPI00374490AC